MLESSPLEKINYINQLSYYLEEDNIIELGKYTKTHPIRDWESYKGDVLQVIESFFEKHLQTPEENEDLDALHDFVNLNVLPIEEIKKDAKIIDILVKTIKTLEKEENNNAIGRIRNLGILDDNMFKPAA